MSFWFRTVGSVTSGCVIATYFVLGSDVFGIPRADAPLANHLSLAVLFAGCVLSAQKLANVVIDRKTIDDT